MQMVVLPIVIWATPPCNYESVQELRIVVELLKTGESVQELNLDFDR